jgi:Holliday junction resolvase RusA-like endonuclease
MIYKLKIKPFSINDAWKGRRYKTKEYKRYWNDVLLALPKTYNLPEPPFEIYFKFGYSSASSDWDNCIKTTQDILAEKYRFNDKLIKRGIVDVEMVKKGQEFFEFEIKHLIVEK